MRRAVEAQPRCDRPVPCGQAVQRGGRCPAKKLTREYKAKLTKAERKAFRSQMWAFRRDPESLTAEEQQALESLFETIPALKELYRVRLRFKEIFDTARDRTTAARW
ncbi:MAG TPA: transposase, partial [Isosphaeraceae bacterium]|nr:transposase [Isosphaeraceae bacterium]